MIHLKHTNLGKELKINFKLNIYIFAVTQDKIFQNNMNILCKFLSEIIFPIKLRALREGHLLRFYGSGKRWFRHFRNRARFRGQCISQANVSADTDRISAT